MSPQAPNPSFPAPPRPLVAVLSSGYFGFFAHAGFLHALEDLGISPDAYAGASSGALVGALAAAGIRPGEMLEGFQGLRREAFWDPPRGAALLGWLASGLRGRTGYLEGRAFQALLERVLPCRSFAELAKPLIVATLDLRSGRRMILDSGPLAPAVRASGAVPLLFSAVEHQGGLLVDGGICDKAPVAAAAERLGARGLLVHLLPSSSLDRPVGELLTRRLTPWRLQRRAVDAAREQAYQDQADQVRGRGVGLAEVYARGLPRLGPGRLERGPRAFAAAREAALKELPGLLRRVNPANY